MKQMLAFAFLCISFSGFAHSPQISTLRKLAITEPDINKRVQILEQLADHYGESMPDSSVYFSRELINVARSFKDIKAEAIGLNALAFALYNKGNYLKSMELLLVCLRYFEELNDQFFLADTYNQIGNINKSQGKFSQAIVDYRKCMEIARSNNDTANILYASMNSSFAYYKQNMLDSALANAQLAYLMSMKFSGEDNQQEYILMTLGNIYSALGSPSIAMAYYKQAVATSIKEDRQKRLGMGYLEIAVHYNQEGKKDSALLYARQSLNAARSSSHLFTIYESSYLLSAIYEGQHNVDSSFAYYKICTAAKDSLFNVEKAQQLENLSFNEQLHQQEIEQQQLHEKLQRKENLQYVAIALGTMIFLISFLLLSHSIVANEKIIKFFGVIALLVVFEFFNLLLHPFLGMITHHSPLFMLLIMVAIAALLVPAHHQLEKWLTHKLVEKNKRVRLHTAQRILASLRKEERSDIQN